VTKLWTKPNIFCRKVLTVDPIGVEQQTEQRNIQMYIDAVYLFPNSQGEYCHKKDFD
jgi:hypothetical protein